MDLKVSRVPTLVPQAQAITSPQSGVVSKRKERGSSLPKPPLDTKTSFSSR